MSHLGANRPAPPFHCQLHHMVRVSGLIAIDDPGEKHCRAIPTNAALMQRNVRSSPKTRSLPNADAFVALAKTWKKLAAELEADQMLLQALSELHLTSQPYEALLCALNIHPGLNWPLPKKPKTHLPVADKSHDGKDPS